MRYGTPYKGSKSRIAKDIVDLLPAADCFVDLFAGGCAVTHAAMLSGKYKRFIVNDIDSRPTKLFNDAVNGKFENEKRWISREEFNRLKDTDGYIALCWSFGNNCRSYLYSKEIEPWKCALHFAAIFNDFSQFENMGVRFDEYPPDGLSVDERMRWFRQNVGEKQRDEYCKWYLENVIKLTPQELDKALAAADDDLKNESEKLRLYLCDALKKSGLKQSEVDKHTGVQMSGHWFGRSQWAFPTYDFYKKLQEILPLERD